ncbi:hypothetical protein BVI434_3190019 [Burkholderia vietnamiensis]|nr:hypothetical protein BVI1335_1310008 [Burkholderia vietnamiensis]CAG9216607.1 hypothetical protein BVI434_3190019 [Burkholderia vietnamiensis]
MAGRRVARLRPGAPARRHDAGRRALTMPFLHALAIQGRTARARPRAAVPHERRPAACGLRRALHPRSRRHT